MNGDLLIEVMLVLLTWEKKKKENIKLLHLLEADAFESN